MWLKVICYILNNKSLQFLKGVLCKYIMRGSSYWYTLVFLSFLKFTDNQDQSPSHQLYHQIYA